MSFTVFPVFTFNHLRIFPIYVKVISNGLSLLFLIPSWCSSFQNTVFHSHSWWSWRQHYTLFKFARKLWSSFCMQSSALLSINRTALILSLIAGWSLLDFHLSSSDHSSRLVSTFNGPRAARKSKSMQGGINRLLSEVGISLDGAHGS